MLDVLITVLALLGATGITIIVGFFATMPARLRHREKTAELLMKDKVVSLDVRIRDDEHQFKMTDRYNKMQLGTGEEQHRPPDGIIRYNDQTGGLFQ